ncbi:MAG: LpxD N-terminal domain-containing protein, partial [Saprospiraceae bacterium]
MKLTVKEIATYLNGTIIGDDQAIITHPGKIEQAAAGAITFLSNPKYESYVYGTKATAVLVNEDFKATKAIHTTLIKVKDVYSAI